MYTWLKDYGHSVEQFFYYSILSLYKKTA